MENNKISSPEDKGQGEYEKKSGDICMKCEGNLHQPTEICDNCQRIEQLAIAEGERRYIEKEVANRHAIHVHGFKLGLEEGKEKTKKETISAVRKIIEDNLNGESIIQNDLKTVLLSQIEKL